MGSRTQALTAFTIPSISFFFFPGDDSTAPQSPALGTRGPLAISVWWHHAQHAAFPYV